MNMKKGAIAFDVLIGVALLAVVAVFLAYFLGVRLFGGGVLKGGIEDLACERSIQDRATFNIGGIIEPGKNLIPLNCKTKQICVSEGGNCEDVFGESSKENPILRHTIPKGKTIKEEVMDLFAENLKNYHKILGQGKLDFMPHKTTEEVYCPIYAWIVLDEEIREKAGDINYYDFYKYMQEKKMGDGTSYLKFVYPGWESASIVTTKLFGNVKKEDERFKEIELEDWKIDLTKRNGYVILAKMKTPGKLTQYLTTAGVVGVVGGAAVLAIFTGGLSLAAIPAAIGIATAGVGGAAVLGGVTYVIMTPDGTEYFSPMIYPQDTEILKKIDCTDFSVAP